MQVIVEGVRMYSPLNTGSEYSVREKCRVQLYDEEWNMGIQIECLIFGEEVTKVQEYCLKDKNLKGLSKTWLVDNSRVKKSNKLLLKDYIV